MTTRVTTGLTTGLTTKLLPVGWQRRWSVAIAAAASLALTVLGAIYVWPTPATAATLVLATKQVHGMPVDRCYLIEGQMPSPDESRSESTPDRVDRLWTRGDRFFIESSNRQYRWAWGQDDAGAVWLTSGRQRGLRLEADEVPPGLRTLCDTFSMQFETLLSQLLQNFELTWESPDPVTLPQTRVVHAVRKPAWSRGRIQEARLEIDLETKVIRKLAVKRWSRTWPAGWQLATVTYTLVGTEAQPDLCYQPEGHLDAPFVIYSREHEPEKRKTILARLYGPWILQGVSEQRATAPSARRDALHKQTAAIQSLAGHHHIFLIPDRAMPWSPAGGSGIPRRSRKMCEDAPGPVVSWDLVVQNHGCRCCHFFSRNKEHGAC